MKPNKERIYVGVGAVAAILVALALALVGVSNWTYFGLVGFLLGLASLGAPAKL